MAATVSDFGKVPRALQVSVLEAIGLSTSGSGGHIVASGNGTFRGSLAVTGAITCSTVNGFTPGTVTEAQLSLTDITTANSTAAKHGLLPKLSGSSLDVLKGDGTWSANPNWLIVRSTADLSAYADGSGGWTLPATLVVLTGTIDLGSGYLTPSAGTVLRGFADAVITSTTTGGVVRCTAHASNLVIREFSIVCFTGPCISLYGGADYQLNLFFIGMIGATAGTISGWNVQAVKQCYINAANGLTFTGTTRKVFVSETPFYGITGSAITLAAALSTQVIDIVTSFFKFDSPGVCITAVAGYSLSSGNLRGSLRDGTAIPLAGLATSEPEWTMKNNTGIADSRVTGVASITATAVTNIVSTGVAVKVAGTTTPWSINERFTHSNNRLTYSGLEPVTVDVIAQYAVDTSNNQLLSFYIAVNGAIVVESRSRVRVGSGADERAGMVAGIVLMNTDDYVEVWVANDSTTDDLTVLSMTLKASAGG